MPTTVVIGRNLAEGSIEIRDRKSGDRREVSVADALDAILAEIQHTAH